MEQRPTIRFTGAAQRRWIIARQALQQGLPIGFRHLQPAGRTGEHLAALGQHLLPMTIGEQAVVADPHEALRQDIQEKTAQKHAMGVAPPKGVPKHAPDEIKGRSVSAGRVGRSRLGGVHGGLLRLLGSRLGFPATVRLHAVGGHVPCSPC